MAAGVTAPLLMAASGSNASPGHTRARPCQAASLAWARRTCQPGGGSPAPAYVELCALGAEAHRTPPTPEREEGEEGI